MLERARQKKSIVKNFINLENFKTKTDANDFSFESGENDQDGKTFGGKKEDVKEDDFDLLYGIENEQT